MFTQRDQQLLSEAYSVQLLKESFPRMTLGQVVANLDEFTPGEFEYVNGFSEKVINGIFSEQVIEELFGGMKALAGMGGGAVKSAGGGVMSGLKGLAQKGQNVASGAIQGVKSAANQVGQNVKDVYNTAEDKSKFEQGAKQAQAAAMQLVQLVKQAQEKGYVTFTGDPMTMPLEDLVDELVLAQQSSKQIAGSAQRKGAFGGAGKAFQKGFKG